MPLGRCTTSFELRPGGVWLRRTEGRLISEQEGDRFFSGRIARFPRRVSLRCGLRAGVSRNSSCEGKRSDAVAKEDAAASDRRPPGPKREERLAAWNLGRSSTREEGGYKGMAPTLLDGLLTCGRQVHREGCRSRSSRSRAAAAPALNIYPIGECSWRMVPAS